MVLVPRDTDSKLLIIIIPMHMPIKVAGLMLTRSHTDQIFARYSYAAKYSAGQALERPGVNAIRKSTLVP